MPPFNISNFSPSALSVGRGLPKPGQLPKPAGSKPPGMMSQIMAGHPSWFPGASRGGVAGAGGQLGGVGRALTGGGGGGGGNGGAAGPAGAPASPQQPSDLDSTYYQNVNDYLFKTNNAINADQQKIAQNRTALQAALGQLNYQQPRSELGLEQRANAGGGLYSSVYNQNLGDLNQKFLTARNNDQTRSDQTIQALTAAIAGLQGSIPLYQSGQAEGAAQRAAAAAQANAALGAAAPGPGPAPTGGGGGGGSHGGGGARARQGEAAAQAHAQQQMDLARQIAARSKRGRR